MLVTHRYLAAILLTAAVAACSQPPPPAPPAPKPFDAAARVKWYQDCWGDFNDKKFDAFKQCYTDTATSVQEGYGKPSLAGADAIVASSQDFAKSFPDGRGEQQLILVDKYHIASISVLHGTNTGPTIDLYGREVKATNKPFAALFGHAVEVSGEPPKVSREIGVMDSGTVAMQLGLAKVPARPKAEVVTAPATVVAATQSDVEAKNIELEKGQIEAWNKHDAAAVDAYFAEDYIVHAVAEPKDLDKAGSSADNKAFWGGFSDGRLDASYWAAGDYVVMEGKFEGTHDGTFVPMKLKKSGNKVTLPFLEIDRLADGKIKETWLFFDGGVFAGQLMAAPKKK